MAGEQRRRRRHVRRSDHRRIDDGVPVPVGQHPQIRRAGPVAMPGFGTRPRFTVLPPGERRHVMSAEYCLVNDCASDEPGSA
jgi:hypothetical protein